MADREPFGAGDDPTANWTQGSGHGDSPRGGDEQRPSSADTPAEAGATSEDTPARFARARRGSLLWNAAYVGVAAVVLLLASVSGRVIDNAPDSTPLVLGIGLLLWTGILVGIAAGGVGRTPTTVVGVVNVVVGAIGFALAWFNEGVPILAMVIAAQVAGFGVVQWVTSIRR